MVVSRRLSWKGYASYAKRVNFLELPTSACPSGVSGAAGWCGANCQVGQVLRL